jgi:cyclopropane fatty-acyl-phospholipid synthase-like methyltransferase
MSISSRDIARYYDKHQIIYTLFWSRTALHYGLWYEDTKSLAQAILNTNRLVVDALVIDSQDTVLDAGCGVGGTSIYVAETTGAKVEGITLSEVQVKIARGRADKSPAAGLLNFSRQDFTKTNFRENTFSKVFGIESVCYAHRKIDFLNEAYRTMTPGGRIAVVDLFLTREDLDAREMKIYTKTIEGWVLPNVATKEAFWNSLEQAGFEGVAFHNMPDHIKKSTEKLYYRAILTYPLGFLKSRLGIGRANFSPISQKALFDRGIATYGVFVAVKPGLRAR